MNIQAFKQTCIVTGGKLDWDIVLGVRWPLVVQAKSRSVNRVFFMMAAQAFIAAVFCLVLVGQGVAEIVDLTPEILHAKVEEVTKTDSLDEAAKTELLSLYRRSLENLETAAGFDARTREFEALGTTARDEITSLKAEASKIEEQPGQDIEARLDALSLTEIERMLLALNAEANVAENLFVSLVAALREQGERPVAIRQRLADIKGREGVLPPGEILASAGTPENEARAWLRQSELRVQRSETAMLNAELLSQPLAMELTAERRAAAAARLDVIHRQQEKLQAAVSRKRQEEAARRVAEASEALTQSVDSLPLLQEEAQKNAQLSLELQGMTTALEKLDAEKRALDQELKKAEASYSLMKRKVELAGVGQSLGFMLHEQRRSQYDLRSLRMKIVEGEEAASRVGLRRMQREEELDRLSHIEQSVAAIAKDLEPDVARSVEADLRILLEGRKSMLMRALDLDQAHFIRLSELDIGYRQYLHTMESYNRFLDERLLWVRSTPVMGFRDMLQLPAEMAVFFAPQQWVEALRTPVFEAESLAILLLSWTAVATLVFQRKRLRAWLEAAVAQAANPGSLRAGGMLQVLGVSMLIASPWFLLFCVLGWQMQAGQSATLFGQAVGSGLVILSLRYYYMNTLRILFRPEGLAEGVFGWVKQSTSLLRHELGRLMLILLPAAFVTRIAFYGVRQASGGVVLGRLALIVGLGATTAFFYRILHPRTGVWSRLALKYPRRWWIRLYPAFFGLIVLTPVIMAGLVVVGYVFSVSVLLSCLFSSMWLAFGVVICHQLLTVWLRRVGRDETPADVRPDGEDSGQAPARSEAGDILDVAAGVAFLSGLLLVWKQVFPALRVLNEITLWGYSSVVDGQTVMVPVTLGSLGLAVLVGVFSWLAMRHLPAILQTVLSRQLDLSPGAVYTVTTLSGYAVSVFGAIVVMGILGFKWSQIQWLVAALGVGIGFGLQEIVANFISGLIILFERPIRVGDIVTVGNTDGVVTRIRIRATTIRDFDRKELLVPNKEFISGQLLNWSLSDPVIRIVVPVGVAYGSDVQQAMDLMMKAARESKYVLKKPKPLITFESFGDNSLLLKLRCFIGSVDDRLPAISDLHVSIDRKFREAGISIAFPQREVHIDTTRPLEIKVSREKKQTGGVQEADGSAE
jgi:potassium efflux system protein